MRTPGCRAIRCDRLIGKMAHPLNRPRFDAAAGRVVEGYARAAAAGHAVAADRRAKARCSSASSPALSGIDPYASAVSDVYQDLFGEGSYAGKGIYDVDAFEAALAGRVPETHAAQPRSVRGHVRPRRPGLGHRGGRGISRPLRCRAPRASTAGRAATGSCCPGFSAAAMQASTVAGRARFRLIGRWKMLDNLRRTLSAPACIAGLAGGLDRCRFARRCGLDRFHRRRRSSLPTLLPGHRRDPAAPRPGMTARSHLRALGADVRLALSPIRAD